MKNLDELDDDEELELFIREMEKIRKRFLIGAGIILAITGIVFLIKLFV
jgi:hypothetical protein